MDPNVNRCKRPKGSWNKRTACRNWSDGPMYWNWPASEYGICLAATEKSSSGTAVTNPVKINSTLVDESPPNTGIPFWELRNSHAIASGAMRDVSIRRPQSGSKGATFRIKPAMLNVNARTIAIHKLLGPFPKARATTPKAARPTANV